MEELHAQDEPGLLKTGLKQITLAFRLCAEPAVMFCNIYIGRASSSSSLPRRSGLLILVHAAAVIYA